MLIRHRPLVLLTLIVAVVTAGLPAVVAEADDAWQAPTLSRFIGGPSEPQVFAWGLDYDSVNDELLVSDYLHRQIRRFDRDGQLLGSFGRTDTLGFFAGVAVDPADGTVYTHTFGTDSDFIRYAPDRSEAGTFDLAGLSAFLAFGADGHLYGNSHKCCFVRKIDPTPGAETIVQNFGGRGTGPGQVSQITGVDAAEDGRVYGVDPGQGVVHVWNSDGSSRLEFGGKGSGPGLFPGDARGIALDESGDRVYVADSDEGQIEVFTLEGEYVDTFGGIGHGPGQFSDGARELAVTPDGHLWAADYGNQRLVEFAPDGSPVGAYPAPAQPADSWGLGRPRDVAWDPVAGQVLVADPWNQRFQRYAPDGELIESRGRRGSDAPEGMNYPRSVGVDPDTGRVWLPHYEGVPGITVYEADGGHAFSVDIPQFANDVDFYGGEAFVPFRGNDGIVRVFDTSDGRLTRTFDFGDVLNGVSVDPQTGHLYVAFGARNEVRIFDQDGTQLGTLSLDGQPWGVDIVDDVVYVTVVNRGHVAAFHRESWEDLGRFGSAGSGIGELRQPSGIDHDELGNIYVAEADNSRISVFTPGFDPSADETQPSVTISSPSAGSVVEPPLVIEGEASDVGSGVATVEVLVQDRSSGLWWDADTASWGRWTRNAASVYGDVLAPSWRFSVVGAAPGGSYFVQVRVTDLAGNESTQRPAVGVQVNDLTGPETVIVSPEAGAVAPGPVDFAGHSTDASGVAEVQTQVRDVSSGMFLNPGSGEWQEEPVWSSADLSAAGGASSEWSVIVDATPPTGQGDLELSSRGVDVHGNVGAAANVTVTRGGPDQVEPDTVILSPGRDEVVASPVVVAGRATDDIGVVDVLWSVLDRESGAWLDAETGEWGSFALNPGDLDLAGMSSDVDLELPLPEGDYWLALRAVDAAGNSDSSPAGVRFVVGSDEGSDTTPPEITFARPGTSEVVAPNPLLEGEATDDSAVARVEVAIRNRSTGQWWDVGDASWGSHTWNAAAVDRSSWQLPTGLPVGDYWASARAVDTAGQESDRPSVRFEVLPEAELIPVEVWSGHTGSQLSSIPAGTAPTLLRHAAARGGLKVDTDSDNFGMRVRVLVRPPVTANYTFWLSSDDNGSLRLDAGGRDPSAAAEIASVPGWSGIADFDKYAEQRSSSMMLEAGQEYYLEAVVKEASGGDHLVVAWQADGTDSPVVVPASAMRPAGDLGADGWEE